MKFDDDCVVGLDKKGPIHDYEWCLPQKSRKAISPTDDGNFVVIYGDVPSKATMFSNSGKKVFDFGENPRNTIKISPQGRLLLFGGFGNLAGYVEVWDLWGSSGP